MPKYPPASYEVSKGIFDIHTKRAVLKNETFFGSGRDDNTQALKSVISKNKNFNGISPFSRPIILPNKPNQSYVIGVQEMSNKIIFQLASHMASSRIKQLFFDSNSNSFHLIQRPRGSFFIIRTVQCGNSTTNHVSSWLLCKILLQFT